MRNKRSKKSKIRTDKRAVEYYALIQQTNAMERQMEFHLLLNDY